MARQRATPCQNEFLRGNDGRGFLSCSDITIKILQRQLEPVSVHAPELLMVAGGRSISP